MAPLAPLVAIPLRVALAVPGGYGFSAGAVALAAVLLARGGMARSEAVGLAAMLGFVLYLVVLLWAFAERRLARLAAVILGGAALAHALAYGLA